MAAVLPMQTEVTWIAKIGSAGIGATWGWLMTLGTRSHRISMGTAYKLVLATAALGGEVFLFSGIEGLLIFLSACVAASALHSGWLWELKRRSR